MKNKKNIIIAGSLIFLVIVSFFIFFSRNKNTKKIEKKVLPTEMIIPTIDSQVKVNLERLSNNYEVILIIENSPLGTKTIDYELSYNTIDQGLQGVIGTLTEGKKNYEKKITLGTCSSGSCVYHKVKGKIRLALKFFGNYGERTFEKEY